VTEAAMIAHFSSDIVLHMLIPHIKTANPGEAEYAILNDPEAIS